MRTRQLLMQRNRARFGATSTALVSLLLIVFALLAQAWSNGAPSAGAVAGGAAQGASALVGGWSPGFHRPGVNTADYDNFAASVHAIVVTSSGQRYAGGRFDVAGDVYAKNIARWDGSRWFPLGQGVNGTVNALAVDRNNIVYAGGAFTIAGSATVNYVARWDGSAWTALGGGLNGQVQALALDESGNIVVGGDFTSAGSVPASHIARWNGSDWSALGEGTDAAVHALAFAGGDLLAGGEFAAAGGVPAPGAARWDGGVWTALTPGLSNLNGGPGSVYAIVVEGDQILLGGEFYYEAENGYGQDLMRWDGAEWTGLLNGVGRGGVLAIHAANGAVYAGGNFVLGEIDYLLRWHADGSIAAVGGGATQPVRALAGDASGHLLVGGDFRKASTAGGAQPVELNHIAIWDDSAWRGLGGGAGLDDIVFALAPGGASLYAGGEFWTPNHDSHGIARWDGAAWQPMGSVHRVYSIAHGPGGSLFIGGNLGLPGGAEYVARWNGTDWEALGVGVNGMVYALATDSAGNLYAGGRFTTAGGAPASYVARWNGSQWSSLGAGMNGTVNALVFDVQGNLYAGGVFTTAGGGAAGKVARWDGATWSALGPGLTGDQVHTLAADGQGSLYAGGYFYADTTAGQRRHLARWNGATWTALGDDPNGTIYALAVAPDHQLYAGGNFTTIGGVGAIDIARWNGGGWEAVGGGLADPGWVETLAFDASGKLWGAGSFRQAGDIISFNIAQYLPAGPAPTPTPTPAVNAVKIAAPPQEVAPGQEISYTIQLSADSWDGSPAAATLTDPIPAFTEYMPGSMQSSAGVVSYDQVQRRIIWSGQIPDGATAHITFRVRVSCDALFADTNPSYPDAIVNRASGQIGGVAYAAAHELRLLKPDLTITGVEVTQAIQNLNNEVTLIRNKETLVRTYVQLIQSPGGGVCNAPGLTAQLTGGASALTPINAPFTGQSEPQANRPDITERSQLDRSLNFALPKDWITAPGSHPLTVALQIPPNFPDTNPANNTRTVTVTFAEEPPIHLFLYSVRWRSAPFPFGQSYQAPDAAGAQIAAHIRAMFPAPEVKVHFRRHTFFYASYYQPWTLMYLRIGHALGTKMLWDRMTGAAPAGSIAYGYVGAANADDSPDGGLTYLVGRSAAGGTAISNGVYVATHEVGHIFGSHHVDGKPDLLCNEPLTWLGWPTGWRTFVETAYPHPNGQLSTAREPHDGATFYGYNAATSSTRAPTNFEIMTYCGASRWISNYLWDKVRTNRTAARADAASRPTQNGEVVLVSGMITSSQNIVELENFYRLSGVNAQPLPEPGDYELRFLQGETVLAAYPFTVTSGAPLTADEPDFTFFDLVVPYHAEATRIEVAYQEQVLTERAVSAHAPTVAVSLPQSTAPLTGTAPITITAHDEDGDPLTYTLLYSADDGATWRSVTASFTEMVYTLDTLLLPGSDQARLRVYASDGVNTGVATSTGFRLAPKAPLVVITSPTPDAYPPKTPIRLEGFAWDGEDEQTGELAVTWSSDVAGHLGASDMLHWQNPGLGWHTLTFTATDSSGMTASDQARVYIGYQLHLPMIQR